MPPERFAPDDPREWLNRARSNLARAKVEAPGVYLEDLCFDAQQAAEKAVKALLIRQGVAFPYVHDLAQLLALVGRSGLAVPDAVRPAADLSEFAVATRYPGLGEPVTREDYANAVQVAEETVRWAESIVAERPDR